MKYNISWLLAILTLFIIGVLAEKKSVCYYGSWARYRPGNGKCEIANLNPFLCTHLVYAFIGLNEDATILINDPWLELPDNNGKDNFRQFNQLKKANPKLKTIVAIGGWNEGSNKYSIVANNPELRTKFAKNAAEFTVKYGFDGFDVDWEYPAQRDSTNKNTDKEAFTLLLKDMRREFDSKGLILSAAVASTKSSASLSYNIPEISKYLDFINVMAYDLHVSSEKVTGHHAALHRYDAENLPAEDSFNVENIINYWLSQGAPPEKIILGLPLYGRTFRLANPSQNAVRSPNTGAGISGQYVSENGMIGYNELCEKRLTESWPELWDDQAKVPYTYNGNDWISYENSRSLGEKIKFALSKNLGGAMVWSVETDDFRNICGGGSYPLLTLINTELGNDVNVPTANSNVTISTPALQISSTTPIKPSNNVCAQEGYFRHATDCSKFYYCSKSFNEFIINWFQCPATLFYNTKSNYCDYSDNVDCHN